MLSVPNLMPYKLFETASWSTVCHAIWYSFLNHCTYYSQEQFEDCKQRMLDYGEISRQLLLGLWYYLPTDREEFIDLYELISDFELAYLVPQSDIPTSQTYCEPLLVRLKKHNR